MAPPSDKMKWREHDSIYSPSSSDSGDAGSLSPSLPAPLQLPLAKYRLLATAATLMAAETEEEEEEEVQATLDTFELEEETEPPPLME